MRAFLRAGSAIKAFYERYDRYIDGVVRFTYALIVFLSVMYNTGYNTTLSNPFIAVALALVCAFLPVYVVTIFTCVLLIAQFVSVSMEVAAVFLVVLILILLLYFVFRAQDSWIMMVTMVLCLSGLSPALLPLALLFTPIEIIVVVFGIFSYGFISVVTKDLTSLASATSRLTTGGRINLLLTDIVSDEKLLLLLIAVASSMLLVTVIRRSKMDDSALIAIVAGDFLFLVVYLLGGYFLGIGLDASGYIRLGVGFVLNALLAFIIIVFVLAMDYKHTENVQFEDDDYYYYVKAIPKNKVAAPDRKVKSITGKGALENLTKTGEAKKEAAQEMTGKEEEHAG
ncbi:MAG: hypothetical protein IKH74_05865 [Lachnospiraceae bacterium]|nr:hypothetical protein [Lachnospiraceae bacterium]